MLSADHHIGVLSFELRYPAEGTSFKEVREAVYDMNWKKCISPLDELLSKSSLINTVTIIDKLEIEISIEEGRKLEDELTQKLPQAIEKALMDRTGTSRFNASKRKHENSNLSQPDESSPLFYQRGEYKSSEEFIASGTTDAGGGDAPIIRMPVEEYVVNAWFYFLQHGFFPETFQLKNSALTDVEEALLKGLPRWAPAILKAFRSSSIRTQLCSRLVQQFSPRFTKELIRQFSVLVEPDSAYEEQAILTHNGEHLNDLYKELFWLISAVTEEKRTAHTANNEGKPSTIANAEETEQGVVIADSSGRSSPDETLSAIAPEPLSAADKSIEGPLQKAAAGTKNENTATGNTGSVSTASSIQATVPAIGHSETVFRPLEEKADVIYVNNAGLVLLHPYLPSFFNAIGCTKDNQFINNDTRDKAVQSLHYLCTGKVEEPEYKLVLEKTFCNVTLEEPVMRTNLLQEKDYAEAENLLRAFISHWSKLRDTSISALQETFLQRPGKLTVNSEGTIRLHVEARGVDILLNYLPFGISHVYFPWMKKMIETEWNYFTF